MTTVVVSDTSPLSYLILIDRVDVLPQLFDRVVVPPVVLAELLHPGSPEVVRAWAATPPVWLESREPSAALDLGLDPGESAAIALAEELSASWLIVDERGGREAAMRRGVRVVGTLGVLERASECGLVADLSASIERLRGTNFRAAEWLYQRVLQSDRERKRAGDEAREGPADADS